MLILVNALLTYINESPIFINMNFYNIKFLRNSQLWPLQNISIQQKVLIYKQKRLKATFKNTFMKNYIPYHDYN